ncbi:hypothetical protein CPB84DRAFT_1799498 [Gymnopilus junonius]|uniref:F-box domain-containing protein n=1 Tax=Gymnopilus junonius TaxID=109634 RepID=A0A9P5N8J9_GYMJU|nr:hypothetical protein CPB84DRAFT_1799498 [Gymnopilus junonius]
MPPRAAKRAAESKLEEIAVDDDELEETEEEVSAEEGSGTESEYDSSGPPLKRAKTSSTAKRKTVIKQSARGKKSLSLLPTMPLDVLFEVFGNLSPKDIFNLAKTNKLFRQTLLSPSATTVWMAARQRFEAPDPPDDMTEVAWAALLFGTTCQKVDFYLRLRICVGCKKDNLVVESRFKTMFPNVDRYILDLIPFTHTGGWSHGYSSSSRFFWRNDISNMIAKLAALDDNIRQGRPNAKRELTTFKVEHMERAMDMKSNASRYEQWLVSFTLERYRSSTDNQHLRRDAIIERFVQLGYTKEDVVPHTHMKEFQAKTLLSDRIWQRIRPIIEPMIADSKTRRLAAEYSKVQKDRRSIVNGLYQKYKASLHPSQWKYLPKVFDVCKFAPFVPFIDAPADSTITADDFSEAMQGLPELLSSASEERKVRARALLSSHTSLVEPEPGEVGEVGEVDALDLAISVFQCPELQHHSQSCLVVGLEDLLSHHCGSPQLGLPSFYYYNETPSTADVVFSKEGSTIAATLVGLTGLDPKSALASDMDKKDLRFSCNGCPPHNHSGSWLRLGFSWRTAITHVLNGSHPGAGFHYVWKVLSAEDANAVKASERSDRKWDRHQWICNHCTTFAMNLQRRVDILDHLQSEHAITNPTEPDDLFFSERYPSPFQGKIAYPVPAPASAQLRDMTQSGRVMVQCLHCALSSGKHRLFNVLGVVQHIKAKPRHPDPQMGKDYAVVSVKP